MSDGIDNASRTADLRTELIGLERGYIGRFGYAALTRGSCAYRNAIRGLPRTGDANAPLFVIILK